MHSNEVYNLMNQLVQEQKALWRIEKHYLADSSECEKCQKFWKKMQKDKKEHIEELTQLIKDHLV